MVDEWSGTPPQSTEFPRTETDGLKKLIESYKQLATNLRESTSNLLRTAGIFLAESGMRIASSLRVEGDLTSTGTLTTSGTANIGGAMNVTGDAVFSGNLAVPNGSITNDALQNPVTFLATFADAIGPFNILGATEVELTRVALVVPTGFTQALVVGYGSIGVVNNTSGVASLAGRIYIDSPGATSNGPLRYQSAPAGGDMAGYPYKQSVVTGLSGGQTITLRLNARANVNLSGTPGGASLNVQVYFAR